MVEQNKSILDVLEKRFRSNMHRHEGVSFDYIKEKLEETALLNTVLKMADTGGEPDVLLLDGTLYYVDFSKETPKGRTSTCYDKAARLSRKKFPPATSAEEMAHEIGIKLLDEATYHAIQKMEDLDLKTSSWLETKPDIRALGGAIFGDKRYERTFIYHNGADSYYGVRGFRGMVQIGIFHIID